MKKLPRQNLIVLEAVINLFCEYGEDKKLVVQQVFDAVQRLCRGRALVEGVRQDELLHFMGELAFYGLIEIGEERREGARQRKFWLKVELEGLTQEMEKVRDE